MYEQPFFSIIIPNFNNSEYIEKCLKSILNQTFTNYEIIIVDDMSTDNSLDKVKQIKKEYNAPITIDALTHKAWNGGSRNRGLQHTSGSQYLLFLDSDDWYHDNDCLQLIYDTIVNNNYPDCVSLSYNCLIGDDESYQSLVRNTPQDLVSSIYVACWTKCIKRELFIPFPENTLMEDVVQHIAQCDVINTVTSIDKPIVVWNRNNSNSCSKEENQNLQQGKWQSSMFRYAADLMDLQCQHKYCEDYRQWRLSVVLDNIKNDRYIQ